MQPAGSGSQPAWSFPYGKWSELVLKDLPNVDPEDERFEAKMTVLSELVEHHADEEEKEMFKTAQRLGDDELKALGERMEARMGQAPTRGRRAVGAASRPRSDPYRRR